MELPEPKEEINKDEISELEKDTDIQGILNLEKSSKSKTTKSGSAEDFVLKQINK